MKKKPDWKILIGIGSIVVIVIIGLVFFLTNLLHSKKETVTTVTKSSLEKILEISDLSTLDFTYNSITDVKDQDKKNVKYHVAYEGTVTAGIDLQKVDISVNEDSHKIVITVPDATVQNTNVDMGGMDFIFEKKKYDTETVSQEAYKACLKDLENKANENTLLSMAKENAVNAITALVSPWVEQMNDEYTIEVK
ncbi:MAG: DUF4230 domain-containing protein [Agathobacter sp.]|nr:DUF4230 domain-containing protein [Agathobacter sp.]MDY4893881.1 DUF4230 domain-containing protein [Agathobacter sp.]